MKRSNMLLTIMFSAALAASPAVAQEENTHTQEITVQGTGSFVTNTMKDGVQQSASNTGGFLASYRFFFNRNSGVEVNYGFENNTQIYGAGGSLAGVGTRSHEASAAYVFRFPLKRITPFALAGTGALVFDPKNFAGANAQARAAFVYGAGADVNLAKHWFLRGEYRGFVYDSPDYSIAGLNGADRVTHRAEPSLGFGFRY
ncbi:MAG TPA: outer membrane beta-barrel protein [Bryobacteraceae bacterium]